MGKSTPCNSSTKENLERNKTMKQLFLILMVIVTLAGCIPQPDTNEIQPAFGSWWREDFDGHIYVIRGGEGHGIGISHDPDCGCYTPKKQLNNQKE